MVDMIKKSCFLIVIIAVISLFSITFRPALSEEQAFLMVFGNYDRASKSAIWKNIPFADKEEVDGFWEEKIGIVKSIFFQPYHEGSKDKVFLLTKTIPRNIRFDCHACLPLIGVTVFVRKQNHWEVEAQNQFVMYDGEYGEPPAVQLISIGKDRFGLSLEFHHISVRDRELTLLVPYKDTVSKAYQEVIYYENFNECEYARTIQCEAYVANIHFDKVKKDIYYELKARRFGTIYSDKKRKTMPIDENFSYRFFEGKYVRII